MKEISPEVEHIPEIEINMPTVPHVPEVCVCVKIILEGLIWFLKTLSYKFWHDSGSHSISPIFIYDFLGIESQKYDKGNSYNYTAIGR